MRSWYMPAGLDGNRSPVATPERSAVLSKVAGAVLGTHPRSLVAIDGRPGAGKSTFADELAQTIAAYGVPVVRSTIDSFHRPHVDRTRLGPASPEGYYRESHQLETLIAELLEPFSSGHSHVLVAAFDEPSDTPTREHIEVPDSAVLVFDGLFLQRPELVRWWTKVVYLEADHRLDQQWLDFLLAGLPAAPSEAAVCIDERLAFARWPRYRDGWRLYYESECPHESASIVIDNNDFARPAIARPPHH